MKILLLGGNGYLGSKVARALLEAGNSIVCTTRASSSLSRIADIKNRLTLIPASIDAIEATAIATQFDYVINAVCSYGRSGSSYDDVIEANTVFPLRILNNVTENKKCYYMTIGTGLPDSLNIYSFSKKILNEFGKFYCEKCDMNFCCLSLEMFYGADEPSDRFFPSTIRKMLRGEDIDMTVGSQHRDIISIQDVVQAIMMVISAQLTGYWEIPIGTGVAPSLSEVMDYMWNLTGRKSKLNKGAIPMRAKEPDCVADVSVIKGIGQWSPMPWKKGIKDMIEDIDSQIRGGIIVSRFSHLRHDFKERRCAA